MEAAARAAAPSPWPEGYDPPPEGWEWKIIDVVCGACGATSQIHEQPPQWLEVRHPFFGNKVGVVWACNECGGHNTLGGEPMLAADQTVLECGSCSSTFAPSAIEVEDGEWVCRVCETPNRAIAGADAASAADGGSGA